METRNSLRADGGGHSSLRDEGPGEKEGEEGWGSFQEVERGRIRRQRESQGEGLGWLKRL